MNKFIGIGNLVRDVELRQTSNGTSYLFNTIAIRNNYKNANGEYDSEFINIQVWRSTAEYLSKYAEKGMRIAIEGRLATRTYEREDGTKGYSTEVICDSVELLGNRRQQEETQTEEKQEDIYQDFGEQITIDDDFLE